jgi:hypothetical protein
MIRVEYLTEIWLDSVHWLNEFNTAIIYSVVSERLVIL